MLLPLPSFYTNQYLGGPAIDLQSLYARGSQFWKKRP